jgi:hypothetical protein
LFASAERAQEELLKEAKAREARINVITEIAELFVLLSPPQLSWRS